MNNIANEIDLLKQNGEVTPTQAIRIVINESAGNGYSVYNFLQGCGIPLSVEASRLGQFGESFEDFWNSLSSEDQEYLKLSGISGIYNACKKWEEQRKFGGPIR